MSAALTFTPDGNGHCLYTENIDLAAIGRLSVARATTIEFDNTTQDWCVRNPDGLALFNNPSRQECLAWERRHIEAREDIKHQSSQDGGKRDTESDSNMRGFGVSGLLGDAVLGQCETVRGSKS